MDNLNRDFATELRDIFIINLEIDVDSNIPVKDVRYMAHFYCTTDVNNALWKIGPTIPSFEFNLIRDPSEIKHNCIVFNCVDATIHGGRSTVKIL